MWSEVTKHIQTLPSYGCMCRCCSALCTWKCFSKVCRSRCCAVLKRRKMFNYFPLFRFDIALPFIRVICNCTHAFDCTLSYEFCECMRVRLCLHLSMCVSVFFHQMILLTFMHAIWIVLPIVILTLFCFYLLHMCLVVSIAHNVSFRLICVTCFKTLLTLFDGICCLFSSDSHSVVLMLCFRDFLRSFLEFSTTLKFHKVQLFVGSFFFLLVCFKFFCSQKWKNATTNNKWIHISTVRSVSGTNCTAGNWNRRIQMKKKVHYFDVIP